MNNLSFTFKGLTRKKADIQFLIENTFSNELGNNLRYRVHFYLTAIVAAAQSLNTVK